MKRIRFLVEYGTYPIWIVDEKGFCIESDIPEEWQDETELITKLDKIQKMYESCFINNEKDFTFVGFKSESDKKEYKKLIHESINRIKEILPKDWTFQDDSEDEPTW